VCLSPCETLNPSKKRKVGVDKGKWKEKVEPELGGDAQGVVLVEM